MPIVITASKSCTTESAKEFRTLPFPHRLLVPPTVCGEMVESGILLLTPSCMTSRRLLRLAFCTLMLYVLFVSLVTLQRHSHAGPLSLGQVLIMRFFARRKPPLGHKSLKRSSISLRASSGSTRTLLCTLVG